MTPGFSLRRIFNRRRYFYARVALNPQQALDLCIGYWVSTGAWGETPGMREQLAQQGWVGTEIADGADTWRMLAAVPIDAIARSDLSPSAPAQPGRSARRQTLAHHDRGARLLGGRATRLRAVVFRRRRHINGPGGVQRLHGRGPGRHDECAPRSGDPTGSPQAVHGSRPAERPPLH